jgi:undecaprenyl pyrophosphate synthase
MESAKEMNNIAKERRQERIITEVNCLMNYFEREIKKAADQGFYSTKVTVSFTYNESWIETLRKLINLGYEVSFTNKDCALYFIISWK